MRSSPFFFQDTDDGQGFFDIYHIDAGLELFAGRNGIHIPIELFDAACSS